MKTPIKIILSSAKIERAWARLIPGVHPRGVVGSLAALLLASLAGLSLAGDDGGETQVNSDEEMVETIEVKRSESKDQKHESLRFLRDNRAFLRAQFDQLRLEMKWERRGEAQLLDERLLMLQAMGEEIAAARDTVQFEVAKTAQRDLLTSIHELGDLEAELDLLEELLLAQQGRLLQLEQDFLGEQSTALVVVIHGLPAEKTPEAILLTEEGKTLRIELDEAQRQALARGGVAQIYHEFVEPREHRIQLTMVGAGWETAQPAELVVDTPRDRLTFLELSLHELDPSVPTSGLSAQIWQR